MLFPPPADNFPERTIGRRGVSLDIGGGVWLSSFKLKLVAYFVLLSLVPMAATYWGLSTVAGAGESRQVTLRQEAGLRAALALYAEETNRAQAQAERVAHSQRLQRALERRDRAALRRILAGKPSLYVVGAGASCRARSASHGETPRRRPRRRAMAGSGRRDGPSERTIRRAPPPRRRLRLGRCSPRARRDADRRVVAAAAREGPGGDREECDGPRRGHGLSRVRRADIVGNRLGPPRRADPEVRDRRGRRPHPRPAPRRAARVPRARRHRRVPAGTVDRPEPPPLRHRGSGDRAWKPGGARTSARPGRVRGARSRTQRHGGPARGAARRARGRKSTVARGPHAIRGGACGDARRESATPHHRRRGCRGDLGAR